MTCRIVAAVLLLVSVAAGDVLVLDDGEHVAGEVRRVREPARDGFVVSMGDGERFIDVRRVVRHVVGRDDLEPATRPGGTRDQQRLASLRRATERLDDPAVAVAKYQKFLEDALTPAVVAEASRERDEWQRRLDAGLVLHGTRWMTVTDRDADVAAAIERVNAARQAVADGQTDAIDLVGELLGHPTTDISGRYLLGVLALQRNELAPARQHFDAVRGVVPEHAPTLLNLGFIQSEIGRPELAAVFAADAAAAAPGVAATLDNLHELLALLDDEQRQARHALRAASLLEQHDPALQATRAAEGLKRWGSDWIDIETYNEFQAEKAILDAEFSELKQQYDAVIAEAEANARRIDSNRAFMTRLEQNSVRRDAAGNLVRIPLPASYYEAERETAELQRQQQELQDEARSLDRDGAAIRQKMPRPTLRGHLVSVGAEGVPVLLPDK